MVTLILIPVAYSTATGAVARLRSSRWGSEEEPREDHAATA
jgi:hypothetical protein